MAEFRARLALVLLILAAAAPMAAAAPDPVGTAHSELARERARLDAARGAHAQAVANLEDRLLAIYTTPEPDPVIAVLTGADLDAAQASLELLDAIGRRDRALVERYRESVAELRAAEGAARRHKEIVVRRAEARAAERAAREAADRAAAAQAQSEADETGDVDAALSVLTTGAGLSVPTLGAPPGDPSGAAADPDGPGRGLPAALIADRALPGDAPIDASTGTRVDSEPAPEAPPVTRALPGIGLVGPASGQGITRALPPFTAVATWYGPGFTRERMAGGEPYDPHAYSTASRTLPLGTLLLVEYAGRRVIVRVNDRGPYVRGRDLQLSQAAAAALALPGMGTVTVRVLPAVSSPPVRS